MGARRLGLLLACATALGACTPAGGGLTVDLRTDLEPGIDFVSVQTELRSTPFTSTAATGGVDNTPASAADDFLRGARVDERQDLAPGEWYVRVSLIDASGRAVHRRTTQLSLRGRYALTVIITRSCLGVLCPRPLDLPGQTECSGGVCVDPRCSPEAAGNCGVPSCVSDGECDSGECGAATCVAGVCLVARDDAACGGGTCGADLTCTTATDAGRSDAGADAPGADATTIDDAAAIDDAATCGGVGASCCGGGGTCNPGAVCQASRCVVCGGTAQPCCTGGGCGAGQLCASGTCMPCGGAGQLCCGGGACGAGLGCSGFGVCFCVGYSEGCDGVTPCCAPYGCGTTSLGEICCGGDGAPCPDGDSRHCCGALLCCDGGAGVGFVCVGPGTFPGC